MHVMEILLWVSIFLVIYTYAGYALIAYFLTKIKKKRKLAAPGTEPLIPVTLIIAAYNEERCIEEKITNSLALEYPGEALKFIFISDGSSDNTPAIIQRYPRILHLHENRREGKVAAIDRAMKFVDTPVVIFSDANTFLNRKAVLNIVRHYHDPRTGGVAGEKRVQREGDQDLSGTGEGLYWKYESLLKKMDASCYSVVGAAGELFSIRTELYKNPGSDAILDDFLISLDVFRKGYRVAYEPEAYAIEGPSASLKEEKKRKIRISAGAFQAMLRMKELLNIFRYPLLGFLYISHRVFRWTLCPLLLPLILVLNIVLVGMDFGLVYRILLGLQFLFYGLALLGTFLAARKIVFKPAHLAYYFLFINVSLYQGFFRFLKGNQSVLWEKAKRA